MPNRYAAFISYAHRYGEWVARLQRNLEACLRAAGREPAEIFLDQTDLASGRSWVAQLQEGIARAEQLILVATPEALASPRVEDEWESFLTRYRDWARGKTHVVMLVDVPLPPFLDRIHRLDFVDHDENGYRRELGKLAGALLGRGPRDGFELPAGLEVPAAPADGLPRDVRSRLVTWLAPQVKAKHVRPAVARALDVPLETLEGHPTPESAASAALVTANGNEAPLPAARRIVRSLRETFEDLDGKLLAELDRLAKELEKLAGRTAASGPLAAWFQQVQEEHRRLDDGFERPPELNILEQAWVQVMVQPALDEKAVADARHELLGQPTTLDAVLALPKGEPSWNQGRWLLEGPPGSGKTTLLRHLAARLAAAASEACVPVFVALPRLVEAGQDLLHHVTDGLDLAGAQGVRDALAAAGRDGRLVLLLDSFDEVPRERRTSVQRLLGQLTRDAAWCKCKLVVSSRPIGRGDALDELPRLDLLPLDEARRREFLENWLRHAGRADWKDEAGKALTYLTGNRWLRDLSGIPLYLTLLATLWQQNVQPSGKLAELYDQIFNLLLDGAYRRDPQPMPNQDAVLAALRSLAHGMTQDDHWAEPLKQLEARLRHRRDLCQQLGDVEAWRDNVHAFLRDVHERTQILGPHDGARGDWRFWHRTFREALTAEQLRQQHDQAGPDALVEWARQLEEDGEGRWAEPLALLTGRLKEADDLVLRLGEANPRLALRAAAFAQGLKPETIVATLGMTGDLEERAQVFEGIPDQLADAGACLALVEQLHEGCRNGFDLFWLYWIVEEVERRWPRAHRTADLLGRFFAHIPPPEDPELLWTLDSPLDGLVGLWRRIPEGEGWVGSPEDEEGRSGAREGPRHRVRILQPFWLGAGPVTNAQYAAFDPGKPFYASDGVPEDQLPVHPRINVTWYEAVSFCRWLGTLPAFAGTSPQLPLEEEWEYACRAGSETGYWPGKGEKALAEVGWYEKNSGRRTHQVGEKGANPWGLYDVHGNVWEWMANTGKGDYSEQVAGLSLAPAAPPAELAASPHGGRVMRGGCYRFAAQACRSACRIFGDPRFEFSVAGFRVLLASAPKPHPLDSPTQDTAHPRPDVHAAGTGGGVPLSRGMPRGGRGAAGREGSRE